MLWRNSRGRPPLNAPAAFIHPCQPIVAKQPHMNFLSRYIRYLKDNPEQYWFKRRTYGWGWVPATWQGWLTLLIFLGVSSGFSCRWCTVLNQPARRLSGF